MPTSLTFLFEYATSTLICSILRMLRKQAGEATKGRLPIWAKPAAILTMFCSAIPTSTNCVGNSLAKGANEAEPRESLVNTVIAGFFFPSSINTSHIAWRLAILFFPMSQNLHLLIKFGNGLCKLFCRWHFMMPLRLIFGCRIAFAFDGFSNDQLRLIGLMRFF